MTIAAADSEDVVPRPEEGGRYDAFVSYQRNDLAPVERMRDALRDRGKFVWMDVDYDNIPPGTRWEDRIRRGIEACNAFMFVISPRSVASDACKGELAIAVELHKLVIPVVHQFVHPSELPEAVARTQWIELQEPDTWMAGIDKLVDALENDVEWRDQHTRYSGLARGWLDHDRDRSYLLRGSDLRSAEAWLSQQGGHRAQPTDEQRAYIALSRQASVRRQRILIGGLATGLVIAIALAVYAQIQRSSAIHETQVAQSHLRTDQALLLTSTGQTLIGTRLDEALMLALEANRLDPAALQPRTAMTDALDAARESRVQAILGPGARAREADAVALSPNGQMLAFGGADGIVRLFDIPEQTLISTASARRNARDGAGVTSLAFAPAGTTLAAGSADGVRVFALLHRRLTPQGFASTGGPGVEKGFSSVAFALGGRILAAGGMDDRIHIFAVSHGALTARGGAPAGVGFGESKGPSVAFSPGGRTLAAGGGDELVRLFGVSRGRLTPLGSAQAESDDVGRDQGVESVAFAPDGRILAVGSGDGLLHVFAVSHGDLSPLATAPAGTYNPHSYEDVNSVAVAPGGRVIAAGSNDGRLRLFAVSPRRLTPMVTIPADSSADANSVGVTSVAFSRSGTLAAAAGDGLARLFATTAGELTSPDADFASGADRRSDGVAFGPGGKTLAIIGPAGNLGLFSVGKGGVTLRQSGDTLSNPPRGPDLYAQTALAFARTGTLAIGGSDGGLQLLAVSRGKPVVRYHAQLDGVNSLDFASTGTMLAVGTNGRVQLFTVSPKGLSAYGSASLSTDPHSEVSANGVAFAPDARLLAAAGGDGYVHLFVVSHGKLTQRTKSVATSSVDLNQGEGEVNSVAFSPDGALVAAGSSDGQVFLFRATRISLTPLSSVYVGHGVAVDAVAFSPDATTLAAGTSTGWVWLFDVSQRTLAPLGSVLAAKGVVNPVESLAFSPDGTTLAAATNVGDTLLEMVWPNYEHLRREVCSIVLRNLSRQEWSSLAPPDLANPTPCRPTGRSSGSA